MTPFAQALLDALTNSYGTLSPLERVANYLSDNLSDSVCELMSGRAFETFGRNDPFAINADDILAVSLLSMQISPGTTSGIRSEAVLQLSVSKNAEQISSLLQQIPPYTGSGRMLELIGLSKSDAQKLMLTDVSPALKLFDLVLDLLSDVSHRHRVATYKLLSRKRPHLLPIKDGKVAKLLCKREDVKPGCHGRWWGAWWSALNDEYSEPIQTALNDLHSRVISRRPDLDSMSKLRIADIACWTAASSLRA